MKSVAYLWVEFNSNSKFNPKRPTAYRKRRVSETK